MKTKSIYWIAILPRWTGLLESTATEIHRFAAIVENEAGRMPAIAAPRLSLQLFYRRIPCGSRERELRFRFRLCQQRQYVRRGCSGGPWAIPRDGRFGGK